MDSHSTAEDYDDDWNWHTPVPDGVLHTMATGPDGDLFCCGKTAVSLAPGEGMTSDPARVTCQGMKA